MRNIDKYNSGNYCGLRVSANTDNFNNQYTILSYNKTTKMWEEVHTLTTTSTPSKAPAKLLNKYYNWLRGNALLNNDEMKYLQGLIDTQTDVIDVHIYMNNPPINRTRLELVFVYNDGVAESTILPNPSRLFNQNIRFHDLEVGRTYSYLELGLSLPE